MLTGRSRALFRKGAGRHNLASGMAIVLSGGIIGIGARYLVAPEASAATFGVPDWPQGNASAFLRVKGIRDIASGLVGLTLLAQGQRRALGWVLLAIAAIPAGDMLIVLKHKGSPAAAFGIHGLTAALVLANAALFLRDDDNATQPRNNGLAVPPPSDRAAAVPS